MRSFILLAMMALVVFVTAVPLPPGVPKWQKRTELITPAAPRWQQRAEQFRLQGLREFEIAERLMTPSADSGSDAATVEPCLARLRSFLSSHSPDRSGDIAPGSLDSSHMRPNAPAPESSIEKLFRTAGVLVHGGKVEKAEFGYDGKALDMRRPTGSRRW